MLAAARISGGLCRAFGDTGMFPYQNKFKLTEKLSKQDRFQRIRTI